MFTVMKDKEFSFSRTNYGVRFYSQNRVEGRGLRLKKMEKKPSPCLRMTHKPYYVRCNNGIDRTKLIGDRDSYKLKYEKLDPARG